MSEACPLCRSTACRVTHELTGHRVARCLDCGFEYQPAFRGGGGDEGTFSEAYYRGLQREAFEAQFADYERDPSAAIYRRWLARIEERVAPGRILDVGSALGTFLKIAEGRGWRPQGVEISRFASAFARDTRGLPVHTGELGSFPWDGTAFDAVTFWDSLEHVASPREDLATAARLLRRGGTLLLTTDNFDSLLADTARLAYGLSRGRVRYPMDRVFIEPNRSYFTESTLRRLVAASGLRILSVEKMEYPIDKIKTNPLERIVLAGFYGAARLLHRQAQLTVLAEKP